MEKLSLRPACLHWPCRCQAHVGTETAPCREAAKVPACLPACGCCSCALIGPAALPRQLRTKSLATTGPARSRPGQVLLVLRTCPSPSPSAPPPCLLGTHHLGGGGGGVGQVRKAPVGWDGSVPLTRPPGPRRPRCSIQFRFRSRRRRRAARAAAPPPGRPLLLQRAGSSGATLPSRAIERVARLGGARPARATRGLRSRCPDPERALISKPSS